MFIFHFKKIEVLKNVLFTNKLGCNDSESPCTTPHLMEVEGEANYRNWEDIVGGGG